MGLSDIETIFVKCSRDMAFIFESGAYRLSLAQGDTKLQVAERLVDLARRLGWENNTGDPQLAKALRVILEDVITLDDCKWVASEALGIQRSSLTRAELLLHSSKFQKLTTNISPGLKKWLDVWTAYSRTHGDNPSVRVGHYAGWHATEAH